MALTFADFVQTELPKRPFVDGVGLPGQILVRSNNPDRPRELVWAFPSPGGVMVLQAGPSGVSGHRAVMAIDGGAVAHAEPADALAFLGISTHAAVAGEAVEVAYRDTVTEASWSWVTGKRIYFTAVGVLTQVVPTATVVAPIGVAISATSILIDRTNPVFLLGA